jgi:hypothetical protein
MARKKTRLRQTHVSVRRRQPTGGVKSSMEKVVQRAPIRTATYSVGERCQIVELMIFCLVDREHIEERDINHLIHSTLALQKCNNLLVLGPAKDRMGRSSPHLQVIDMWNQLIALKLLKSSRLRQVKVTITPKGKRHIKKQPKRLRLCAQKLVYTELLEKLARVAS